MNDHLKAQQVMNDSMSKLRETFQTWLQQRQEQVVNLDTYTLEPSQCRKIPICYDEDDDEESSFPLRDIIISGLPLCIVITPILSTAEPVDSLIMEDEHLDTIPATESDEVIKSSVENLVQNPSESKDECECDMPDCDDSQTTNFQHPLFDLDEEIISSEFNPIHNEDPDSTPKNDRFDVESYLLESLVNQDTLMVSPPKIDFIFDEFAGELTHLQSIPPGIDNINLDPEGDILFLESLLYDNSSPRPPEAFQANSSHLR
ncbi:hypothetical protein Tco_1357036 [Tanacetum coccineum]